MNHIKMIRKIILFSLIALPVVAFAETASIGSMLSWDYYKPASGDVSLVLLQGIFGQVGNNVLPGRLNSLFGAIFRVFNQAVLLLGVIFLVYVTIRSVIKTASEGAFLGNQHSALAILRWIIGIGFIFPGTTGYSLIQVLIMSLVVRSIGLADSVWNTMIDYFNTNTSVVAPISSLPNQYITTASNIFYSALCMQRAYHNMGAAGTPPSPTYYEGTKYTVYDFAKSYPTGFSDCGRIALPSQSSVTDDYQIKKIKVLGEGFKMMVEVLNQAAIDYMANPSQEQFAKYNPLKITSDQFAKELDTVLAEAKQSVVDLTGTFWQDAKNQGWIYAGAYFHQIALINNNIRATGLYEYVPPNVNINYKTREDQQLVSSMIQDSFAPSLGGTTQSAPLSVHGMLGSGFGGLSQGLNSLVNFVTSSAVRLFVLCAFGQADMLSSTTGVYSNQNVNPIIRVQNFGTQILDLIKIAYQIALVLMTLAALVLGIMESVFPGLTLMNMLSTFVMTPVMLIGGAMFMTALTMAVYVPLIPFIIFTFAAIGWMIAVMEAMIAAPIVALGLISPSGDEMFGRAEPAINLMANIFLRPTLMLFGLISGMVLSYVAVDFVNSIYEPVVMGSAGGATAFTLPGVSVGQSFLTAHTNVGAVELLMYIVVYVTLISVILNRCFSLIHIIPDRILEWIGGHALGEHVSGGEEQVKQKFEEAGQQVKSAEESAIKETPGAIHGATKDTATGIKKMFEGGGAEGSAAPAASPEADPEVAGPRSDPVSSGGSKGKDTAEKAKKAEKVAEFLV